MISSNKSALQTPIIGRVIELNRYVWQKRPLLNKDIRHNHYQSLLSQCDLLFAQAMREVRGKDYLKRANECLQDIQAKTYLIYALNVGWNMKIATRIDMMCDEISEHLFKISESRNARINKFKDEVKRL